MHSKYDNMNKNRMFYALICINNYTIISVNCILWVHGEGNLRGHWIHVDTRQNKFQTDQFW